MKNILYLFVLFLCACSSSDIKILVANSGETQGTYYHIKYLSSQGESFQFQIDSLLAEIDHSVSLYKSYSIISKLNAGQEIKTLCTGNNNIGGVCSFIGLVRETQWGGAIKAMTLEHYAGMTEKQLAKIEIDALESGVNMVGDFKRHEAMFETEMIATGEFKLLSKKKIGPLDLNNVGGVFVYVYEAL